MPKTLQEKVVDAAVEAGLMLSDWLYGQDMNLRFEDIADQARRVHQLKARLSAPPKKTRRRGK